MSDLKPCPCGAPAATPHFADEDNESGGGWGEVYCTICTFSARGNYVSWCQDDDRDASVQKAIETWNTRVTEPDLARALIDTTAERDALRERAMSAYEKGLRDALSIIASIGYGKNPDMDEGHEEAYRAIEAHLAAWKTGKPAELQKDTPNG